jgi:hypothetical protein
MTDVVVAAAVALIHDKVVAVNGAVFGTDVFVVYDVKILINQFF